MELISCEDTIADDLDTKIKSDYAQKIIETKLTKREKEIIKMRYGINNIKPKTQKEVSSVLGISRSYVSGHVYGQRGNGLKAGKINEI